MAAESAEEREARLRQMRKREWLPSLLKRVKPGYVGREIERVAVESAEEREARICQMRERESGCRDC